MVEVYLKDFSNFPGPRYRRQGSKSAEEFRDDVIMPLIEAGEDFCINFDGVLGVGSMFLEELFGGLIRKGVDPIKVFDIVREGIYDDVNILKFECYRYVEKANEKRIKNCTEKMTLIGKPARPSKIVTYYGIPFGLEHPFNCIATNKDGSVWAYTLNPERYEHRWDLGPEGEGCSIYIANVDLGNIDWKTTCVKYDF